MPWRCRDCKGYFSVKSGTAMHKSVLPYKKWVRAVYFMLSDSKGESALKIRKIVGVKHKTAWTVFHRIREGMAQGDIQLDGIVQWDETFVGPNNSRMHSKKKPPGRKNPDTGKITRDWKANKVTVVGGVKDDGFVVAFPVENDKVATLQKRYSRMSSRGAWSGLTARQLMKLSSFWGTDIP